MSTEVRILGRFELTAERCNSAPALTCAVSGAAPAARPAPCVSRNGQQQRRQEQHQRAPDPVQGKRQDGLHQSFRLVLRMMKKARVKVAMAMM